MNEDEVTVWIPGIGEMTISELKKKIILEYDAEYDELIENVDYIVCQICNKKLKQWISSAHLKSKYCKKFQKIFNINVNSVPEYKIIFPNAQTVCKRASEDSRRGGRKGGIATQKRRKDDPEFDKYYREYSSKGDKTAGAKALAQLRKENTELDKILIEGSRKGGKIGGPIGGKATAYRIKNDPEFAKYHNEYSSIGGRKGGIITQERNKKDPERSRKAKEVNRKIGKATPIQQLREMAITLHQLIKEDPELNKEYRAKLYLGRIKSNKCFCQLYKGFIVLSGDEKRNIDDILSQGYTEKDFIKEGVQRIIINRKYPTWPKIKDYNNNCYKIHQPTEDEKEQLEKELLEKVQLKCLGDFYFFEWDIVLEYHIVRYWEGEKSLNQYYHTKRYQLDKKGNKNTILIVTDSLNHIKTTVKYIEAVLSQISPDKVLEFRKEHRLDRIFEDEQK